MFNDLVAAFEELNAEVTVTILERPSRGYRDQTIVEMAAGTAPDIVRAGFRGDFAFYADAGGTIDLSPYLEEGFSEDFFQAAWTIASIDGVPYGIPLMTDTHALFYSDDYIRRREYKLVAESGAPGAQVSDRLSLQAKERMVTVGVWLALAAGEFTIFTRVVVPLAKPAIAVLVILGFSARWNAFAWPLVALTRPEMYTVQLGINYMKGYYFTDFPAVISMVVVSIIPILIMFLTFRRNS